MTEIEKDPTMIDEYLGEGKMPDFWLDRIRTLRIHKRNFGSDKKVGEAGQKLYSDNLEILKKLAKCNEFKSLSSNEEQVLKNYPNWEPKHFEQLLIQLGEEN